LAEIATICPFCGCGCGIYLHVSDGRVAGVSPSRVHPVSQGRLCLKGWHAHELVDNPARLTRPLVRRGDELQEATWAEALAKAAEGLSKVRSSAGPPAIGVLGSARCTNEDNYVLARFARTTLGTPSLDCSQRIQCFPELPRPDDGIGLGVSTGQIADLDDCDLILMMGADPTEENPAVAARIYRARQRGTRLVAASTRSHQLARLADVHLPVRPGAEMSLIGSLLHVLLIERRLAGKEGGEVPALRASVADLKPENTAAETGVSAEAVRQAAELYEGARRVVVVVSTGLSLAPQASEALQALSNLAALSRQSAGPQVAMLSLVGRNNLQGCRDMGVVPHYLPGYGELTDDAVVQRFEHAWRAPLTREVGLSAWQMLGEVKALYVVGDDLLRSLPDPRATREALAGLEFLVAQDIFLSPTAAMADVVLPAASFAERNGTWTNLERRVQRIHKAMEPPGEAREDWRIIADLSAAMDGALPYRSSEEIFEEITSLVPVYAGVFYPPLAVNGGIRWPTEAAREKAEAPFSREDLGIDDRPVQALKLACKTAQTSEQYPLLLGADPTLATWDGEVTICATLTVGVEFTVSAKDYPDGMLCLNPADAQRYRVRNGRSARVTSPRGETRMQVRVSDEVPEGVALAPYYHGARSGLMEIAEAEGTGRPVLAPTAISVGPES